MFVMLKIEHGFTLWANGHLTMDVIESAQQSGTRFKFIGQQKDWAFNFDKWGRGVNDYVASMLKMESKNHLGLCDEARQMVKSIVKKASKGLSALFMSETQAQLTKAPGWRALLKEGQPPAPA